MNRKLAGAATAAAVLAAVLFHGPVVAQDTRNDIELTRDQIRTKRTEIVTEYMDLTQPESDKFWPLYRKYHADLESINPGLIQRASALDESTTPVSDKDARGLLDEYLKTQKSRVELQQKYVKQFSKVLPPRKLVRYFQLENKMDAVVNLGLAGSVPMLKQTPPPTPGQPNP